MAMRVCRRVTVYAVVVVVVEVVLSIHTVQVILNIQVRPKTGTSWIYVRYYV